MRLNSIHPELKLCKHRIPVYKQDYGVVQVLNLLHDEDNNLYAINGISYEEAKKMTWDYRCKGCKNETH